MTLFKPELAELLEITRLNADHLAVMCTENTRGKRYTIHSVTYRGSTVDSELIESSEEWEDMDAAHEFHQAIARTETVFMHCLDLREGIYKITTRQNAGN
jgi:hypothetical protein